VELKEVALADVNERAVIKETLESPETLKTVRVGAIQER
jgi:hypothetical protein